MDIDYAIRKNESSTIITISTPNAVKIYESWERSNRLSIMFIKTHISTSIRGSIEKYIKVKDLIKVIDEKCAKYENSLTSTLIIQFSSLKFIGVKVVYDNIMHNKVLRLN